MRITGGRWRSRPVKGPGRMPGLRPTPDALRERAFAVIGERVRGARFLDLYAGTGAVGLEALSRGAASVVFVEAHRSAGRLIEHNMESFNLEVGTARLLLRRAAQAVAGLHRQGETFDLVWADPPFERWRDGLEVVTEAFARGLITETGRAYLECPERADLTLIADELVVTRDLEGGASRLWIIERRTKSGELRASPA